MTNSLPERQLAISVTTTGTHEQEVSAAVPVITDVVDRIQPLHYSSVQFLHQHPLQKAEIRKEIFYWDLVFQSFSWLEKEKEKRIFFF